jgi:hypothetical protein
MATLPTPATLPPELHIGEYAIVGSAVLQRWGIRQARDIDLVVTATGWERLQAAGWAMANGVARNGQYDAGLQWSNGAWHMSAESVIARATILDGGIAYARIDDVVGWKKAAARAKDVRDLALIREWLQGEPT